MTTTKTVKLNQLTRHMGQMRTTINLQKLAELTVSVYYNDIFDWNRILVSQGGGKNGSTHYPILSGNRRYLAKVFATALPDWLPDNVPDWQKDQPVTAEMALAFIGSHIPEHDNDIATETDAMQAAGQLAAQYNDTELKVVVHKKIDEGDQLMTLQASNYNNDAPDLLGEAISFQMAVVEGKTPQQIANAIGQTLKYVTDRLALAKVATPLANLITREVLPLSVAALVTSVKESDRREGLTRYLIANQKSIKVGDIKAIAKTLREWPGLQLPLMSPHQANRNIARILVNLWHDTLAEYPDDAWAAACGLIHRDLHEEPWADPQKMQMWVKVFGNGPYYSEEEGINWTQLIHFMLPEVSCETCPISRLPATRLRTDVDGSSQGATGMPCRRGQTVSRCLHGAAENDTFILRVPAEWADNDGVTGEAGQYFVKGAEALTQAWQAQQAKEQAEDEAEAQRLAAEKEAQAAAQPAPAAAPQPAAEGKNDTAANGATATAEPTAPSPVQQKRTRIASFMAHHLELTVKHPFASQCALCQYRREDSPVKDSDVPHCDWAKGSIKADFHVLVPAGKAKGPHIPICGQFTSTQPWKKRIPAHPSPPEMPREWFKTQILAHTEKISGSLKGRDYGALEWLTGRPLKSESHRDWFKKQLAQNIGELSDAQLYTLLVWALGLWHDQAAYPTNLPVDGAGVQFAAYKRLDWEIYRQQHNQPEGKQK